MKTKSFLLSFFMLIGVFSVHANPTLKSKPSKISVEQHATNTTDTMKVVVGLTDEQYQKLYAINLDYYTNRKELKLQSKSDTIQTDKADNKSAFIQLYKKYKTSIHQVLTDEQRQRWQEYKKQNIPQQKQHFSKNDKFKKEIEEMPEEQ